MQHNMSLQNIISKEKLKEFAIPAIPAFNFTANNSKFLNSTKIDGNDDLSDSFETSVSLSESQLKIELEAEQKRNAKRDFLLYKAKKQLEKSSRSNRSISSNS